MTAVIPISLLTLVVDVVLSKVYARFGREAHNK